MKAWFNRVNRPIRIKSLKELEPGFTPKHFRYSFRLVLIGMMLVMTLIVAHFLGIKWMFGIALLSLLAIFAAVLLLNFIPPLLRAIGYYWPWLYLKSIQLDNWLELDLDWGPPK